MKKHIKRIWGYQKLNKSFLLSSVCCIVCALLLTMILTAQSASALPDVDTLPEMPPVSEREKGTASSSNDAERVSVGGACPICGKYQLQRFGLHTYSPYYKQYNSTLGWQIVRYFLYWASVNDVPCGQTWYAEIACNYFACNDGNMGYRVDTSGVGAHVWDATTRTCTLNAKCKKCDARYTGTSTAYLATGHTEVGTATCTKGSSCSKCNGTPTAALGHAWATSSTTAATCTAATVHHQYCTRGCGGLQDVASGNALGHAYNTESISSTYLKSAATCTAAAVYYHKCDRCTQKGTTTFSYGSALAHSYTKQETSATYLKSAATCTAKAQYYYRCATCTAKGTSTFEYGSALNHNYTKQTKTSTYLKTAATCTADAVYYYQCSRSGCTAKGTTTYTDTGSATGHTYGTKTVSNTYLKSAATCTNAAVYYYKCNNCSVKGTTTYENGNALGHVNNIKYVAATYKTHTRTNVCARSGCGATIEAATTPNCTWSNGYCADCKQGVTYHIVYNGNGATSGSTAKSTHVYGVSKVLSANGFVRKYTMTFNHNYDGGATSTQDVAYTFIGWSRTQSSSSGLFNDKQAVSNLSIVLDDQITLNALWDANSISLPTPTRQYYTFLGWSTDANDGTVEYEAGESFTPTQNITLYAVWRVNNVCSITSQPSNKTVTYPNTATLSAVAEGMALSTVTYQWQESNDEGESWANIDGATSSSYTPAESKTAGVYYYRLVVTSTVASENSVVTAISATVKFTIKKAAGILTVKDGEGNDIIDGTNLLFALDDGATVIATLSCNDGATISVRSGDTTKVRYTLSPEGVLTLVPTGTTSVGTEVVIETSESDNYETKQFVFNVYVCDGPTVTYTADPSTGTNTDIIVTATIYDELTGIDASHTVTSVTLNGNVLEDPESDGKYVFTVTNN